MSSSSSDHQQIYDVFLNFRGQDTRRNFVSHLHSSLANAGISTFIDDEEIRKGEMLGPELYKAIEGSKISIAVFSENYCGSIWCLDELVKIMECHRNFGQVVLPVFYGVDPSDVRHQDGNFGGHFLIQIFELPDLWRERFESVWRRALTEAANLAGWDVRNCRSDSKVVNEIVDAVLEKLDIRRLPITDFPIGLESRVQDVNLFLMWRPFGSYIVGIWGMGGVGKTTLAKAIYNKIFREFEVRCFLGNIREVWQEDRGQIRLQEQLLSAILNRRKVKIHSIEWGKGMIKERMCRTRALVILDDVNKLEQLHALCASHKWHGPESVIIVTTRDVHLLNILNVDYVYKMREMDEKESLLLFSQYAFRGPNPSEDFRELSRHVGAYCGGLPLALEVLGSFLYKRTKEEWKSVLSKLKRIPNDQIQEKLKISFDGLRDHMEKDIFLDICCFFIGKDRAYVTHILDSYGLHAEIGITVLIERSLLKVEKNNKLGMHDLLRDMGREIVRQSSPEKPEKRSRLWFCEDVLEVLRENTGAEDIKGLALKLQSSGRVCFSTNAFEEMKRLRLLQLNHVQLIGDYGHLSRHLRWVNWQGFCLKHIPDNFYQQNLVVMDLKHSNLKLLWKEPQLLLKLKILNLSHSRYLRNTPDFSNLPNLEKLILKDCPSLSEVHQSIGDLSSLLLINLKDCTSLSNLPRMFYKLKSLKTLIISGCSKIDKLEEDIEQMSSLTTLIANNTGINQVPFSLARSKSIGYISLCGYEGLARDQFPSLIWSWMSPTMNLVSCIHPFGRMSSPLVSIDVQNVNLGDLPPMLSGLSKLRSVRVQCCSELQLTQELRRILDDTNNVSFPELETTSYASQTSKHSLKFHWIGMGSYHQVLNILSEIISQGLTANVSDDFLPGNNYPSWLTHTGEGHSVIFNVPQVGDCCMKGMILCVYSSIPESMAALISVFIINYTKRTIQLYKRDAVMSFNDAEWMAIVSNLGPDDKVEILVDFGIGLTVKKTTVYLLYGDSINLNMEPSPEPEENALFRSGKRIRT